MHWLAQNAAGVAFHCFRGQGCAVMHRLAPSAALGACPDLQRGNRQTLIDGNRWVCSERSEIFAKQVGCRLADHV